MSNSKHDKAGQKYCAGPEEKNVAWQGVRHLWEQQLLCDATLVAGGRTFHVHRCYLSSCSDYFLKMFTGNFRESTERQVEIEGVTATGLEAALTYMYSGEIVINEDNITDVMEASSLLQVMDIQKFSAECLKDLVSVENCLQYLKLADLYSLKGARCNIIKYMCENFTLFGRQDQFLTISVDLLCELIGNDWLDVELEILVLERALAWLHHQADRYAYANKVLSLVRFGLMTVEEIESTVTTTLEGAGFRKFSVKEVIQPALRYHLNLFSQPIMHTKIANPRSYIQSLVILGGKKPGGSLSNKVLASNCTNLNFTVISEMPTVKVKAEVAVLNNFLFLVGGYPTSVIGEEVYASTSAYRYNPRNGKWLQLASMNNPRACFALVAVSECLIAVGGQSKTDEGTEVDTVEKYNFEANEWKLTTSMRHASAFHAGCAHSGRLYISGGYLGRYPDDTSKSLQQFNLELETWQLKSPMNHERAAHTMACHENKLFVVGGWSGDIYSEVYDIESDQWTQLQYPLETRYENAATSIGNTIYIVGGNTSFPPEQDEHTANTILGYDMDRDNWRSLKTKLPTALFGQNAGFLKVPRKLYGTST